MQPYWLKPKECVKIITIMDNKLKQLRLEHGYTIRSLAEALNKNGLKITSMTISRYERGEREPKLATWQKLADFFNVDVPYLQGIQKFKNSSDRKEIFQSLTSKIETFESQEEYDDINKTLIDLRIDDDYDHLEKIYKQIPELFGLSDNWFDFLDVRLKLKIVLSMEELLTGIIHSRKRQNNVQIDNNLNRTIDEIRKRFY